MQTRPAATVSISYTALARLLPADLMADASVVAVTAEPYRDRIDLHLRGGDLPEEPIDSEPRLLSWVGAALDRAATHPLGQLIESLASHGNPTPQDAGAVLAMVIETLESPDLECLGLVDERGRQPITAGTKAALIDAAAQLLILAGLTLDGTEATDVIALDDALVPDLPLSATIATSPEQRAANVVADRAVIERGLTPTTQPAAGCMHTPGGHGLDVEGCHRCAVESGHHDHEVTPARQRRAAERTADSHRLANGDPRNPSSL
jgi:hypothetical protein